MKRAYCWLSVFVVVLCFTIAPIPAHATSGWLRSDSIKTCPNGTTYGQHGNGHWHVAVKQRSGGRYQASGNTIASDPCPGYTVNQGTAAPTNQQPATPQPAQPTSPAPQQQYTPTTQPASTNTQTTVSPTNVATSSTSSNKDSGQNNDESTSEETDAKKEESKKSEPQTKTVIQKYPSVDVRLYDRNDGDSPVRFEKDKYESSQNSSQEYFVFKLKTTNGASAKLERGRKEVKSPAELKYGNNEFTLVVKDRHGHTNKYKVVVKRNSVASEVGSLAFFIIIWAIIAIRCKMLKWGNMNVAMKIYTIVCVVFILGAIEMIFESPNKDFKGVELKDGKPSITIKYPSKKRKVNANGASVDNVVNEDAEDDANIQRNGSIEQQSNAEINSSGGAGAGANDSAQSGDPMSGIVVAEAASVSYARSDYQPNWSVGGGCDIRSRMLTSSSTVGVQYGRNGCTVTYGSWVDPYTGVVETGNPYRGDGTVNDMDIDHIIPLHYVNNHGGSSWPASKKRQYGASLEAMNQGVYVAVSASANRQKSDKGPSQYYPPNGTYRCEYSRKWRDIARLYGISLSSADYNVIRNTLVSCGISFDFRLVPTLIKFA